MSGSFFDIAGFGFRCPKCGEYDEQPIAQLLIVDKMTCRLCGFVIDLTAEDWKARISKEAEDFKQIKPPPKR